MAKIILTNDASHLDFGGNAFAVVHPGLAGPAGIPAIGANELLEDRDRWLSGDYATMAVVGLSRMLTPSNRVKLGQVLLRERPGLTRFSVDDRLFVADPWRLWWHFRAVGEERWGFSDSFLAETRWRNALDFQTADPFDVATVLQHCADVVRVVGGAFRFAPISVQVIPISQRVRDEYVRLKEQLFGNVGSIAGIIKGLAAFAQQAAPERKVPTPARLFAKPPSAILRTDLPVDEFLTDQLLNRVRLTNAIADLRP